MRTLIKPFYLTKSGNQLSEYEDAFFPFITEENEKEGKKFRFSVADGASAGILSGEWARTLTEVSCLLNIPLDDIHTILETSFSKWNGWLADYFHIRKEKGAPIKWYEEPGLQAGAFATLLALDVSEEQTNRWQVIAVGDSCLFQVRGNQLITTFPIMQSNAFNNNPALICSTAAHNYNLDNKITKLNGEWETGDEFYLMTDAIAQWFLAEYEVGREPWNRIRDLHTTDNSQIFEVLVNRLRENSTMRNDDVTVLHITVT